MKYAKSSRFLLWDADTEEWERWASEHIPLDEPWMSNMDVLSDTVKKMLDKNPFLHDVDTLYTSEFKEGYRLGLCSSILKSKPMGCLDLDGEGTFKVGLQLKLGWRTHDLLHTKTPTIAVQALKCLLVSLTDDPLDEEGPLEFYDRFKASVKEWSRRVA